MKPRHSFCYIQSVNESTVQGAIRSAGNAGQAVFCASRKKPGRSAAARVSPLGKDAAIPGEACLAAKRFPAR